MIPDLSPAFSGALTSPQAEVLETLAAWVLQPDVTPPHVGTWNRPTWQMFGHMAYLQGVLPYLHSLPFYPQLPAETQATVATGHDLNAQRNQRLLVELTAALEVLQRAGIPVMPLKGAVLLLKRLYPNEADRVLHDLDLLVPKQDLTRAREALLTLGYVVDNVTWRHVVLHPPGDHGVVSWTYDHPDNPRRIDLHTHVRENFRGISFDLTDYLWQHAAPVTVAGTSAWIPANPALLHHLAAHGSVSVLERLVRLVHLVDLAYLSERLPADQVAAGLTAPDHREARFLYPALGLAATYSRSVPLAAATERLATGVSPRLLAWVRAGRLCNRTFLAEQPRPGETLRFWPTTPRETWTVVGHTLFHTRDEFATLYPKLAASRLFWLCYPRFWASLLWSLGRRTRQALTRQGIRDGK